jgi:hypothetical protein
MFDKVKGEGEGEGEGEWKGSTIRSWVSSVSLGVIHLGFLLSKNLCTFQAPTVHS